MLYLCMLILYNFLFFFGLGVPGKTWEPFITSLSPKFHLCIKDKKLTQLEVSYEIILLSASNLKSLESFMN